MTSDAGKDDVHALDSLGRILGEVVHDLAGDLIVLQGWAHLARGEAEAGRSPAAELDRVVDLSESLGVMLRDLLAVAHGRALSPEVEFSPRAVTEESLACRVRELSAMTVRFRTDLPADARIRGFGSFWGRILSNLLSNSARHAQSQVLVTLVAEADQVVLRVEDDGPGVGADARERVFQPLWSGDSSRTGLGLSSVSWLAQRLGGVAVCVEPRQLRGAAFEVRAPRVTASLAPSSSVVSRAGISGRRFLLIDDETGVRQALGRLLSRVGAEPREFDPRQQGTEKLLQAAIAAVPDVVLMDLRMGRRSGTDVWDSMRSETPSLALRTIFMTGAAPGDPDWESAVKTGQPVLAKPFTLDQLAEAVSLLP